MALATPKKAATTPAANTDAYTRGFARLAGELASGGSPRLQALRQAAIERFAELGFPTTRQEAWRFTNVAPIARTPLTVATDAPSVTAADIERYHYADCTQMVLVNGRLAPEHTRLLGLPEGVVVSSLAEAWQSHPQLVEEHLCRYAKFDDHAFVALNTALHADGVFIYVPKGVVVETPINLILVGAPQDEPLAFFPRLLFVTEESSQVTIFEQHVTVGEGTYFTCPVLEIVAGANTTIDHYKLQRETLAAFHMSTLQVKQHRDSNFSSHCLSWGGLIVRNDVNTTLDGENCTAILNGLYMVEGKQLVDNHMRVEHNMPNCYSHELYKGILEGKSRGVFTGLIYVKKDAQKTDAVQANRNLLLSNEALCNSQPQLEILADDVRCTHGSTVGQLDKLAIFYLRSRGIGEEAARSLLTYAFAADIVTRVKLPQVRRDLEEFLFRRLPKGEIVRQAV
ncbi:MAG: Fe-S cluster assembly protein SufD [Acidobacteria bacterium]|nr:Fe-S cluster assembly protein SufD [Acidobacteriota bacterium]